MRGPRASPHILTAPVKARMENKGLTYTCEGCGESISEGDEIVSRVSRGLVKRVFHRSCWDGLFI